MAEKRRKKEKPPTHIKDARGRKVTQLDPVEMRLLRRHDVIEAAALKAIADDVGSGLAPGQKKVLRFLAVGLGLVAIVFLIRFVDLCIQGNPLGIFENGAPLFHIWFWPMMVWFNAKRIRFGRIKKIMLQHRRCPHCGYDLQGLPADEADGATICPECGCAWRLDGEEPDDTSEDEAA
jgi:hypothetical protein